MKWDRPYSQPWLERGLKQTLNARVSMTEYVSGATQPWLNAFVSVLAAVFILSLVLFAYLLFIFAVKPFYLYLRGQAVHPTESGLMKDYTELQELFLIALNSPQPGRGSPMGIAREKEGLQNMKWRLRNRKAVGHAPATPCSLNGGLDELCVVFNEDEEMRVIAPHEGFLNSRPPPESRSPRY